MRRIVMPIQIGLVLLLFAGTTAAQVNRVFTTRPDQIDADIIKAGLRTAEPEDQGFVERVMANVDCGIVPRDLVESTFDWARKQNTKRKFQYFKYALIERARTMGIDRVDAPPPAKKDDNTDKPRRLTGIFGRIFSFLSLESLRSRF